MTEEFLLLKRIKLIILIGLFLLTACNREDKAVVELLDRADSLLRVNPDSALKLLSSLSHSPSLSSPPLGEVGRGFGMELRMRYWLLKADALNKTYGMFPSDTLMKEVVEYYDRHGNANERMRAHYLLGRVYHDMGEAPMALECYQQAAEQADTTKADCDLYTLYAVYGQMADLYYYQYLPEDELRALDECERIAWKDKDTLSAITAIELHLRPYFQKNDTDSVLHYVNASYNLYNKYGYKNEAAKILYMRIITCIKRKQINEAGKLLNIYKKDSGLFNEQGDILSGKELFYYYLGCYQLELFHQDSALYWFNRVLSYGYTEAGYKGLLDLYKQKKIPDSIAKYAELFAKANDDSYLENSMELVSKQTQLYNYHRHQHDAFINKEKALFWKSVAGYVLATLVFLFLLVGYIIREYNEKMLHRFQMLMVKWREAKRELEYKEKLLHEDIQKIQQLKELLKSMEYKMSSVRIKTKKKAFMQTDIFLYFDSLRTYSIGYTPPTQEEWSTFINTFQQYFPEYFFFIQEKNNMTSDQIRLSLLCVLDFEEDEMSLLLSVDGKRITRVKEQINRKLFQKNTAKRLKENLSPYFNHVDKCV